jgi:luciferase-like monooxygenase
MPVANAKQLIDAAVTQWPDETSGPHRFGGLEWKVGRREIGHIHGNALVDIAFPPPVRDELVASGRAQPHHIYPQIGISFHLEKTGDIEEAIALLRRSYELVRERSKR